MRLHDITDVLKLLIDGRSDVPTVNDSAKGDEIHQRKRNCSYIFCTRHADRDEENQWGRGFLKTLQRNHRQEQDQKKNPLFSWCGYALLSTRICLAWFRANSRCFVSLGPRWHSRSQLIDFGIEIAIETGCVSPSLSLSLALSLCISANL